MRAHCHARACAGGAFAALLACAGIAAYAADPNPEIVSLRAQEANELLPPGASPLVAVLDTGFEVAHPGLSDRLVPGYNVFTGGADVGLRLLDPVLYTHATAVASIITSDEMLGAWPRAVYPAARVLPIKVCCLADSGYAETDSNLLRQGILYAAGIPNDDGLASPERAAVINVSYVMSDTNDPGLIDAIRQATSAGCVVVTALGESTPRITRSLAAISGIVGVWTAHDGASRPLTGLPIAAIPAPGSGIVALMPTGTPLAPVPSEGTVTGSSFATAVASAVAAMLVVANPDLGPGDVASILSSPEIYDAEGMDAVLAVQMAESTLPSDGGGASQQAGLSGGALDGLTLWIFAAPAFFGVWRRRRR